MIEDHLKTAASVMADSNLEADQFKPTDISSLMQGHISFDHDMKLPGTNCCFGDIVWDFNHENLHQGYLSSNHKMHWWSYFTELPADIKKHSLRSKNKNKPYSNSAS